MVTRFLFSWVLSILAISSMYALATATATIDRNNIAINETFQLTLSIDENSLFDKPDISVLEKDFSIIGQQKSSQSSWINGKKSATTEWLYQLSPKHTGIISIPSIEIDGQITQPLSIKVTDTTNQNSASGSNLKPVFMESIVDKQNLYVQEQLLLTIRINSSINLQNLQLQDLKIDNAFVVQVSNTSYQRPINNIPYMTYELVYAIFPQTSGKLDIPSIEAAGINHGRSSFNSFFGGGSNMHIQSDALTINVNSIPEKIGSQLWLPAKNLNINENWSADPENIKVGDSITRTITTTASGLSNQQLPPISMQNDSHYKIYPDQPKLTDTKNNEGIVGERKDSITIVATQPGEITLPAISIQWWDISSNEIKSETLPEVTIKIHDNNAQPANQNNSPAFGNTVTATTPSTMAEPAKQPGNEIINTAGTLPADTKNLFMWQIATAISSTLALLFLALFLTARKKPQTDIQLSRPNENPSLKISLQAINVACTTNDIAAIRQSILAWARIAWPNSQIHSLSDIHHICKDDNLKTWLNTLDACLYTHKDQQVNWVELYQIIEKKQSTLKNEHNHILKPLYPA